MPSHQDLLRLKNGRHIGTLGAMRAVPCRGFQQDVFAPFRRELQNVKRDWIDNVTVVGFEKVTGVARSGPQQTEDLGGDV